VLRNDKLVETLMGRSAPIEVVAKLLPDPATPSGYKWSSSKGPPTQVMSGTLATGSVVVESRRPISYVLPVIKRSVGAS
jgi:HlyD family secretion protein